MNPQALSAWLQQNKKPALLVGAAAVGGLGLLARKRKAAAAPGTGPATTIGAPTSGGSGLASWAGVVPTNNSASSDVYNALQPSIEALQNRLDAASTIPVPAKPSSNTEWLANAIGGWVGQGGRAIDEQYALTAWLQGAPVSESSMYGINYAVKNFGAPPEGTKGLSPVNPG